MILSVPVIIDFNDGIVYTPVASPAVPIRVNFVLAAILSGAASVCIGTGTNAAKWSIVITLDGVDVTERATGDVLIAAEESTARIAEFALRPTAGTAINLAAWSGAAVTIDVVDISTGSPTNPMRLFSGFVDTPALNQTERTIALRCTDDLQGRCDRMTSSQIDDLIVGYYSPAVFDAAATGWARAHDRLSTVPASLDISPDGALRLTPWAPKPTADITLDASVIGSGSLTVSVANRASLVNDVLIDFGYRFPRVKAEGYRVGYTAVDLSGFAAFILAGRSFMQRAQVEAAIAKAGGHIESITYTDLPNYIIAVGAGYWSPGPYDSTLCMQFTALVSFDYAQRTEEQHQISVVNALSIAAVGAQRETLRGALEGVYPDLSAAETAISRYKQETSGIPPPDVATPLEGKTASANVTLSTDSDRAAANAAMETLISIARARIYGSHRNNSVGASVPLIPAIDVDKTIAIDADGVLATGKCRSVTHHLSTERGTAVTDFDIALCALAGVGIIHADDAVVAPAGTSAGETDLTLTPNVTFNNLPTEDRVLTISFPGVAEIERAKATRVLPSSYAAPIAEDLFTVTI